MGPHGPGTCHERLKVARTALKNSKTELLKAHKEVVLDQGKWGASQGAVL